jgi:hypothetical protein
MERMVMDLAVRYPGALASKPSDLAALSWEGIRALEIDLPRLEFLHPGLDIALQELSREVLRLEWRVASWLCEAGQESVSRAAHWADLFRSWTQVPGTVCLCVAPEIPWEDEAAWLQWGRSVSRVADDFCVTVCVRTSAWTIGERAAQLREFLFHGAPGPGLMAAAWDPGALQRSQDPDLRLAMSALGPHIRIIHARGTSPGEDSNYPLIRELIALAPECDALVLESAGSPEQALDFLRILFKLWPPGDKDKPEERRVSLYPVEFCRSSRWKLQSKRKEDE